MHDIRKNAEPSGMEGDDPESTWVGGTPEATGMSDPKRGHCGA